MWRYVARGGVNGRGTDGALSVLTPSSSRARVSSPRRTCPPERPSLQPGALEDTRAHFHTQRALQPPTLFARSRIPTGVPSSALQRGGQALARRRGPHVTDRLGWSSFGRGGDCGARGQRPRYFARSGFPARGSQLCTAAGRSGRVALLPLAVLLLALQRGVKALARPCLPQRTPRLCGVIARRRGDRRRFRLSPLLFARSMSPARGSVLGAAAGRQGFDAPQPPAADPPTLGGHRSAAR